MGFYIHAIEGVWALMIVGVDDLAPESGQLKGLALFAATTGEAEREALVYLGCSEPVN